MFFKLGFLSKSKSSKLVTHAKINSFGIISCHFQDQGGSRYATVAEYSLLPFPMHACILKLYEAILHTKGTYSPVRATTISTHGLGPSQVQSICTREMPAAMKDKAHSASLD